MRRDCQCEHQARNVKFDDSVARIFKESPATIENVQNAIELLADKVKDSGGKELPSNILTQDDIKDSEITSKSLWSSYQISRYITSEVQDNQVGKKWKDKEGNVQGEIFNWYGEKNGSGGNEASGEYSHAEGYITHAIGEFSHTEGSNTYADKNTGHAEGYKSHAYEISSHAEGNETHAHGQMSHAEGNLTKAYGSHSHTEGMSTQTGSEEIDAVNAAAAHAEGGYTKALGPYSHAGGYYSEAKGVASIANGDHVMTTNHGEVAFGVYNSSIGAPEDINMTIFSVGKGSSSLRSNAIEVKKSGDTIISGQYKDKTGEILIPVVPIKIEDGRTVDYYLTDVEQGVFYAFYEE